MRRLEILSPLLLVLALLTAGARAGDGAAPIDFLTDSTAAYVEISKPKAILDLALSENARSYLKQLKPIEKYLASNDFRTLETVVELLEVKLDVEWPAALETLTSGGVAFAFDTSEQALLVFVNGSDAELLGKLHAEIVELIEADASDKGKPSPVKSEEYHGATGWSFGKNEAHVLLGNMLVVSNKVDALKRIVDRQAADDAESAGRKRSKKLLDDPTFQAARKHAAADDVAFAFLRLAPIRLLANLTKALDQKSNNPLVEVLLGGVLDAVGRADYAAATLTLDDERFRLAAHLPHDREGVADARTWFFSPQPGDALGPLSANRTIATFTARRDVAGMWLRRTELFDDKTNVGLTQADTNLGLYFSGKDFGSQVLGELEPQWRFIAAAREYGADGEPVPALKLPSFALVWELKHPEAFAPHLQMAFQNIIGITNIDGAQKGRPQLLLKSEQRGDAEIHYGTYLIVGDQDKSNAPVHFNFRPACARVGKHFVVGSHVDLVRELAAQFDKQASERTTHDSFAVDVETSALAEILDANRPLIVGRQMLSAGGDKQDAERQLDLGLQLLRTLDSARVRLIDGPTSLTLEAAIQIAP